MVTTVFLQISRLKPDREGNNTRVRVRSLKVDADAGTGSWQSMDIKSLLQAWLRQPGSNYAIDINAFDPQGEDLAVTSAEPGEEGLVRAPYILYFEQLSQALALGTGITFLTISNSIQIAW